MNELKSGFVALLGRPNVGKSTLMNHLIGQKIAITANRAQTTRNRIRTVYTDKRGQAVFFDTPGVHKARNKLGEFMVVEAFKAIKEADVILWLVEPTTYVGKGEQLIAGELGKSNKPVILIINKADLFTGEQIEAAKEAYRGLADYKKILEVSALRAKGVSQVMDTIFAWLPAGHPFYDEDTVTDQPMRAIAAEIVREKAFRLLNDEIPHGVAVQIEKMKQRPDGMWDIEAEIICERESHKGIIIGKGGQMLKKIGTQARVDIEEMTEDKVNLKLWVKVRKDWRDDEGQLKNFGYFDPNK